MDIDAAIAKLNELSAEIDLLDTEVDIALAAEEMCQVWDGVMQWLVKGGELPRAWAR